MILKVRWFIDQIYQVIDLEENVLFQGNLTDCQAYIWLYDNEYFI